MGARNQVGIGLSYRPASLGIAWLLNYRLGSWNRFLALYRDLSFRLWSLQQDDNRSFCCRLYCPHPHILSAGIGKLYLLRGEERKGDIPALVADSSGVWSRIKYYSFKAKNVKKRLECNCDVWKESRENRYRKRHLGQHIHDRKGS